MNLFKHVNIWEGEVEHEWDGPDSLLDHGPCFVPVELETQECVLWRSEPKIDGAGYVITLLSDEPADSLTMHGKVWLSAVVGEET